MTNGRSLVTRRVGLAIVGVVLLAMLVLGLVPRQGAEHATSAAASSNGLLSAEIRRTANGIPHILADDFAGLGFGYGYAFAEDNICTIADSYITVRAERSRYFGPDVGYPQRGNGFNVARNRNSDYFYQRLIDNATIEELLKKPSSEGGPMPDIRQGVRGYVAGYNKYLRDTGVDNLPDPRCRGAAWVKPISEIDAYRRFYQLALLASQTIAIDGIGSAQPPAGPADGSRSSSQSVDPEKLAAELGKRLPVDSVGSNAYGLGKEATSNEKGIVLGNPHFPWDGPERLYQAHLTIPDEVNAVNVAGASLYGVPLILIGHTEGLAWSHTVSTAYRFTPFEETLNPADPTQYLYDGKFRDMKRDEVTIKVKAPSGQIVDETRTLYSTHHGSIITNLAGVSLPWAPGKAFTMGDVNAANFRYLNHFFETNLAQDVGEYDEIQRTYQGIPWVNSIAADSDGEAYYADIGAIPNVSNAKAAACNTPAGDATYAALRLPILNGTTSACEWDNDPDAAASGIFGPSDEPSLFREDYVTNSNDSYWLSNPEEPLTGFARIIGDENTARILRTRIGIKMIEERFGDPEGRAQDPISGEDVQDMVFNNRQYAGELWRDELVTMCENAPGGFLLGESGPVDVSGACQVLADWDLKDDLDSNGAILFRRFAGHALNPSFRGVGLPIGSPIGDKGGVFTVPFNPLDPVHTPRGLNIGNPVVQKALADAVTDLNSAEIPLGAPLRGQQFERRGSERIPIHGGPGGVGVFNAINVGFSGSNPGYPNVPHGSSFVIVAQFTEDGCPADARTLVTYSQSENPDSPYFADQTRLYSNRPSTWVNPPFCENEVLADPSLTTRTIEECTNPDGCEALIPDGDGDGIADDVDNCPAAENADQIDRDSDGLGDECDPVDNRDRDGDGVLNPADNCPDDPNPNQDDGDGDGVGDVCDEDEPDPDPGPGPGSGGGTGGPGGGATPLGATGKAKRKKCTRFKSKRKRKKCKRKRRRRAG